MLDNKFTIVFVQSYVNYCSLVWGFTGKSNIDSLFAKQKKALRAVIPGFINYKYKDGKIPGHTKSKFSEYKILTIHNIIALNAFLLLHKVHNYPTLLPKSIRETIPESSPIAGSNHESCVKWLKFTITLFITNPYSSRDHSCCQEHQLMKIYH